MDSVKAQSIEDARHKPAGEPVEVVGKYEVVAKPGPGAIDNVATKSRQIRQQRRPCRPSVRAAVDQDDRHAVSHDLHPHADPSQLNALFDWAESHMRPEPTLHFSIPLFVLHVSPSLPAILRECPFRKVQSNRSFDAWLLKHMLAHERGPAFAKISLMAGIELILRWVRWIVVVWSATRRKGWTVSRI